MTYSVSNYHRNQFSLFFAEDKDEDECKQDDDETDDQSSKRRREDVPGIILLRNEIALCH